MDEKKTATSAQALSDEQLDEVTGGEIFTYYEGNDGYYFCSDDLNLAFWCQRDDRPVRYIPGSEPKRFYCEKCKREYGVYELNRRTDMALWRSIRTQQPV